MRVTGLLAACLLIALAFTLAVPAPIAKQEEPPEKQPKSEKFGALAFLQSGAGRAMVGAGARVNVDLYVKRYTSDAEAKSMAGALLEGGPDALLKRLEDAKSIGKVRLTGRAGFYDLSVHAYPLVEPRTKNREPRTTSTSSGPRAWYCLDNQLSR